MCSVVFTNCTVYSKNHQLQINLKNGTLVEVRYNKNPYSECLHVVNHLCVLGYVLLFKLYGSKCSSIFGVFTLVPGPSL